MFTGIHRYFRHSNCDKPYRPSLDYPSTCCGLNSAGIWGEWRHSQPQHCYSPYLYTLPIPIPPFSLFSSPLSFLSLALLVIRCSSMLMPLATPTLWILEVCSINIPSVFLMATHPMNSSVHSPSTLSQCFPWISGSLPTTTTLPSHTVPWTALNQLCPWIYSRQGCQLTP